MNCHFQISQKLQMSYHLNLQAQNLLSFNANINYNNYTYCKKMWISKTLVNNIYN